MFFSCPKARFKVYSSPMKYAQFLWGVAFGSAPEALSQLEESCRALFNTQFARCVPQARVGIHLALKAVVKPGAEVIMSPFTIADVVNMVVSAGAKPVFADTERDTCNIAPESVHELIGPNTGAVLVTHMHGLICRVEEIADMCSEAGVPLIEDAAQAFGAHKSGVYAGTFGDAGIFSFGQYKTVHSFYGGMVVSKRADINEFVEQSLQSYEYTARKKLVKRVTACLIKSAATTGPLFGFVTFPIFRLGMLQNINAINRLAATELDLQLHDEFPDRYRERMTATQAQSVLGALAGFQWDIQTRIGYAKAYHEGLKEVSGIVLPPMETDGSHIYTCFALQVEDREGVIRELMRRNRDIAIQHIKNCADLDAFKAFYRDCPNARQNGKATIMLPTYPSYGRAEVDKNIEALQEILG